MKDLGRLKETLILAKQTERKTVQLSSEWYPHIKQTKVHFQ